MASSPAPDNANRRLESWKEIAAYLHRDVRTVQRWEKMDRLPIHRQARGIRPQPYAYTAELDRWWGDQNTGEKTPADQPVDHYVSGAVLPSKRFLFFSAAVIVLLGVTWWIATARYMKAAASDPLWILVGAIDNASGEPRLSDVVEPLLTSYLSQSRAFAIVGRPRVNDTLALMRKPAGTRLDSATATEVCLRDGYIGAAVIGRIEKVSVSYELIVDITAPCDRSSTTTIVEPFQNIEDVTVASQRMGRRIRDALGEPKTRITSTDRRPRVTTRSFKALTLYTEAETFAISGWPSKAEPLLREAIRDDPDFALAYLRLAYAVRNQGRLESDYMPLAIKAEEAAKETTDVERLFVRAGVLEFQREQAKACSVYESLLSIEPNDYWAVERATACNEWRGDWVKTADGLARLAALRPNNIDKNVLAAWANEFLAGAGQRAMRFLQRAEMLQMNGQYSETMDSDSWLRFRKAYKLWLKNDVVGALTAIGAVAGPSESNVPIAVRDELYIASGQFMLTLGRIGDAKRQFARILSEDVRPSFLSLADYAENEDRHAARQNWPSAALFSLGPVINARVGFDDMALGRLAQPITGSRPWEDLQGVYAVRNGNRDAAIEHLSNAIRVTLGRPDYFFSAETLALVLAESGRMNAAVQVLEEATAKRHNAYAPARGATLTGYAWIRARLLQAELYERCSQFVDAETAVREIVDLLQAADPQFPLLIRARQLHSRVAHEVPTR